MFVISDDFIRNASTFHGGDLHHENILAAERAPWLAIDPKGVIGEPAYEMGALLRNRLMGDSTVMLRAAQASRHPARHTLRFAQGDNLGMPHRVAMEGPISSSFVFFETA